MKKETAMARRHTLAHRALRGLTHGLVAVGLALALPAGPAHGQDCKADPAWFQPGGPPEPDFRKDFTTNCDFHRWAVQEFLYLVQPEANKNARFLNLASPHSLFLYTGDKPAPYPGKPITRFQLGKGMAGLQSPGTANAPSPIVFLPRTVKTPDGTFDGHTQAGSNAILTDQKGQWVYYTSTINRWYYDFVLDHSYYTLLGLLGAPAATAFPEGTVETKTAWRIAAKEGKTYIPDADQSYYTTVANICRDASCSAYVEATMALVGFHVVGTVHGHPEMIWATFEHRSNAPGCAATPSQDPFSFYTSKRDCGTSPLWRNCNQKPTDNTKPSEVCRVHPYGEPAAAESVGNTANIQRLNQSYYGQLPEGSVWRNYFYAGSTWTTGKVGPDGLIVTAGTEVRGSTKLANTSLESFTQEQNCFSCHITKAIQMSECVGGAQPAKNLYLSHLFGLIPCPPPSARKK
jgi:hypothetical protein